VRRALLAAAVAALAGAQVAAAFTPTDPLAPRQWFLASDRAFDAWAEQPALQPIKVAVIDSGIDGGHPEFQGRIAGAKSFVGGSPLTDEQGHGTFIAGEIAAGLNNGQGIAGIAFTSQLLIAKVVRSDGSISLDAEAQGIRWASAIRPTAARTRSRSRRRTRSSTRCAPESSSWPRSETATRRPRRRGRTRAIPRPSRTCSASGRSTGRAACRTSPTATRSSSTSPRPARRSSPRSRAS
jgi:hypothetical protein